MNPDKLEKIDRSSLSNFIEYWSYRPWHFEDTFHKDYSVKNAIEAYNELFEID